MRVQLFLVAVLYALLVLGLANAHTVPQTNNLEHKYKRRNAGEKIGAAAGNVIDETGEFIVDAPGI